MKSTVFRTRAWFIIALLLLMELGGCSGVSRSQATTQERPMDKHLILDSIEDIAKSRPFIADTIAGKLGISLGKDSGASNQYFSVYRSGAARGDIESLEVREPTDLSHTGGKGGMVLFKIKADCIKKTDIGERFGPKQPGPPATPRPTAPKDTPRYDRHSQSWGDIRLGYSPTTGCLVSVVLDAN